MTDDVLSTRIALRVSEIKRSACATLVPVAQLKALAAMTAILARSSALRRTAAEPTCSGRMYSAQDLPHPAGYRLTLRRWCGTF